VSAYLTIVFDKLPDLGAELRQRAAEIVKKAAFDLEARAKLNAHVLTGAMRASIYTSIAGGQTDYGSNAGAAAGLRPGVVITPEQAPTGEADLSATVGVSVNYGIYEELRAGHEFLLPAADAIRPSFEAAMQELIS
jgi:hypothetical protein